MAEEIQKKVSSGTADLAHIPDPALARKHRIKSDVVFVSKETDIKAGRRVWITFRRAPVLYFMTPEVDKDNDKKLYNCKVAMYISQAGKWGIMWLDDKFWRVVRKKRLAKEKTRYQAKSLKLDIVPLDIEESRAEGLRNCVADTL